MYCWRLSSFRLYSSSAIMVVSKINKVVLLPNIYLGRKTMEINIFRGIIVNCYHLNCKSTINKVTRTIVLACKCCVFCFHVPPKCWRYNFSHINSKVTLTTNANCSRGRTTATYSQRPPINYSTQYEKSCLNIRTNHLRKLSSEVFW